MILFFHFLLFAFGIPIDPVQRSALRNILDSLGCTASSSSSSVCTAELRQSLDQYDCSSQSTSISCDPIGNVVFMNLEKQKLNGTISSAFISQLSMLTYLSLAENSLHDRLPSEIGQLSKLTTFDVHSNNFSGALPSKLFQLSLLTYL